MCYQCSTVWWQGYERRRKIWNENTCESEKIGGGIIQYANISHYIIIDCSTITDWIWTEMEKWFYWIREQMGKNIDIFYNKNWLSGQLINSASECRSETWSTSIHRLSIDQPPLRTKWGALRSGPGYGVRYRLHNCQNWLFVSFSLSQGLFHQSRQS